jgi:hypothetical protein
MPGRAVRGGTNDQGKHPWYNESAPMISGSSIVQVIGEAPE